ncbi:siderophore ABC transporter substrate-binding protein [Corynebacterium ulceribovis]|uniref:siderophore ABC transporter substrate-binding protein n=1 Tax=Corynebacterium ulceribovis TaxID=487732 RepID=UPI0003689D8F|nr:ABC transporter substrate-binding protein [Corynebacterium ulceribovis]
MKLISRIAVSAVMAGTMALVGCSGGAGSKSVANESDKAQTITVQHTQGELTLDGVPEKVVVLDFAALDVMDAIGESDKVTAIATVKNFPEVAQPFKDKAVGGSMKEPDLEAIAEAEPDLIIINARTQKAYGELAKIAPTLDLTSASREVTLDGVLNSARTIGTIFQKEEVVDAKISELKAKAKDVAEKSKGVDAMMLLASGGELSTFGANSRFGMVFQDLGFRPSVEVEQAGPHGQVVSFEYVADANPTHIFVLDRDKAIGRPGNSAEAALNNQLIATTKAAKARNIHYLDGAKWYLVGGGLNTLGAMIDEVAQAVD